MTNSLQFEVESTSVLDGLAAGGYVVQHAIGSGAGGQVYKAVQRSTGQAVAIKVMTLGDADPSLRQRRIERFRREIAFCSALYHPDIVRLLDSGELSDGNRFAVFEFIPGRTLAEVLRDERMLKVQRARSLMMQALPPLAYAHAKGIAHRDLKPGNVMVTTDAGRDRLKVLDFGISVSVNAADESELVRLTRSHEWLGTPLYAAPEQLRGEPTNPKSDLYAWALMFYECLTGTTLISGKSLLEIMNQQARPEPHVLPAVLAQHRLGSLLQRVLEKDPARRLGDALLVHSLLERISMDGLEDENGYLRDASPVSAQFLRARPAVTDTVTDAEPAPQTEQRHVIALCCRVSLVGAGTMSGVEQVDALLDDSYNLVSEVLRQFGATAAQSVGGYSLWYFGLSHARDADGRLAVRGALELVNRTETLPSWFGEVGLSLVVQIGIHSGPVTLQFTESGRKAIDGVTARVAMELSSLDPIDRGPTGHRVLASDDFRQLVARHADFAASSSAELRVPGRAQPVQAYQLTGESRTTGLRAEKTPFFGREPQLGQLIDAWHKTGTGEGAAVLIEGEAGVGKSRLVAELMTRLEADGCRAMETRCLPEWQNASLRPLHVLVSDLLGVSVAPGLRSNEQLERHVTDAGLDAGIAVPLLSVWLAVTLPPGYAPLAYSPAKQRQLLHETIAALLLAHMNRGALMVVEDVHWADPSTLECLNQLLASVQNRPLMAILTTRPERSFASPVPLHRVVLTGLASPAAAALAASLVPAGVVNDAQLAEMVARADGIPLYLEELAIALRSQQLAPVAGSRPSRQPASLGQLPPSLRSVLSSRLEEMGRGRETAQFAAALGREFPLELLARLSTKDELSLIGDLEELTSAQILVKRLRLDSPVYSFRHALIRDAAYDNMPAEVRRRSHELIAEGLVRNFPSLAETEPDVLAHHYDRAQVRAQAVHYWHLAAQRASAASAHEEAATHIDRSLEIHRDEPSDAEQSSVLEAGLLLTRGAILVAKRGYTDPDAHACFARITELVPAQGAALQLAFAGRWGVWYFNNARCNLDASCSIADELRSLAQDAADSALSISAWAAVCQSRFCVGKLEESVRASRESAKIYDIEQHRGLTLRYGDDPRVAAGSFEALAEMIRGRTRVALERADECWRLIDQLGYASLGAGMHGQAAWLFLQWGDSGAERPDYTKALSHAANALKVAHEYGFPFWEIYGKMNELAIRIARGEFELAQELKTYADMWSAGGASLGRDWHLAYIARGLHGAGDFAEARRLFDESLTFCNERGLRYFEPEVRRLRAVMLADARNPERDLERAIEECWKSATDARSMGAGWWEIASLVSAIRMSRSTAPAATAQLRQLLELLPIEPDEPPLLREARAIAS